MPACNVAVRFARVGVLVLLLAVRAFAEGQVLVVGPVAGPGVEFTTVNAAVAAATDNDTILIQAGDYDDPVSVGDKSLAIVARPGDLVTISEPFEVIGLAANRFVSLTGLTLTRGLTLEDNAGAVWAENCAINGTDVFTIFPEPVLQAGHGVEVIACINVTITGTSIRGGHANNPGGTAIGGAGLVSSYSSVWLFDVDCEGGGAAACPDICSKLPGDGADVTAGQLFAEGASFAGLFGIRLFLFPTLWLLDTDVQSTGGGGTFDPIEGNGTVTELAGAERDFTLDTPAFEQDTLTLTLTGLEGDSAWILLGLKPGAVMSAHLHGPLLVPPPHLALSIAVLPPGGTLSIPVVVPVFVPGIETLAFVLQAAFVQAGGGVFLSDPSRLVMVGAQF